MKRAARGFVFHPSLSRLLSHVARAYLLTVSSNWKAVSQAMLSLVDLARCHRSVHFLSVVSCDITGNIFSKWRSHVACAHHVLYM